MFYSICEKCPARPKLSEIPVYPPTPVIALPIRMTEQVPAAALQSRPEPVKVREGIEQVRKPVAAQGIKQAYPSSCGKHIVYFRFNHGDLSDFEKSQLKDVLPCLKASGKSYSIAGYTCQIGSQKNNDRVAVIRASSVATYLKENGVKVCSAKGQGKTKYMSSSNEINRRAEIIEKGEAEECR